MMSLVLCFEIFVRYASFVMLKGNMTFYCVYLERDVHFSFLNTISICYIMNK